jgi:hypothetical protein
LPDGNGTGDALSPGDDGGATLGIPLTQGGMLGSAVAWFAKADGSAGWAVGLVIVAGTPEAGGGGPGGAGNAGEDGIAGIEGDAAGGGPENPGAAGDPGGAPGGDDTAPGGSIDGISIFSGTVPLGALSEIPGGTEGSGFRFSVT